MHPTWIIAKRELRSYFDSPIAYIVIVAFLLVAGWMYFSSLFLLGQADLRHFFSPSPFSPSMLLVILAPAVTMRLIAEERKTGTLELLTTLPIRDSHVIVGKFLSSWLLILFALMLTLAYPITVATLGDLDWGPVLGGYLGFALFSGTLLAIGVLASTWTENQIIAFIVGFLLCATLYFIYWLHFFMPPMLAGLVESISLSGHLENMARGIIDSRDVLYYLTLMGAALFLGVRSLAEQHA